MTDDDDVDWSALRSAADQVRKCAHAPYSGFAVGAAGLTDTGRVVTGCNVENASLGMTLCAECGLVSSLRASGGSRLVALVCVGGPVGDDGDVVMPCGRCRQLLEENGGGALRISAAEGPVTLEELLPRAFGRHSLEGSDR